MREVVLAEKQLRELEDIYEKLQQEYARVAATLEFSCSGCPDNCCDSYFLHHTYVEWGYLWLGIKRLDPLRQQTLIARAKTSLTRYAEEMAAGRRPQVMCPLNEDGLCVVYEHRLLVCRTHGVPATMTRPDGQTLHFPGCFRCQDIARSLDDQPPYVARTPLLTRLALLENELLHNKRHLLPRVKMTIAEMLVKGPPTLP